MKKNMSRKLIALALAAAFSTTLASCGAPAAQPSSLPRFPRRLRHLR